MKHPTYNELIIRKNALNNELRQLRKQMSSDWKVFSGKKSNLTKLSANANNAKRVYFLVDGVINSFKVYKKAKTIFTFYKTIRNCFHKKKS